MHPYTCKWVHIDTNVEIMLSAHSSCHLYHPVLSMVDTLKHKALKQYTAPFNISRKLNSIWKGYGAIGQDSWEKEDGEAGARREDAHGVCLGPARLFFNQANMSVLLASLSPRKLYGSNRNENHMKIYSFAYFH